VQGKRKVESRMFVASPAEWQVLSGSRMNWFV